MSNGSLNKIYCALGHLRFSEKKLFQTLFCLKKKTIENEMSISINFYVIIETFSTASHWKSQCNILIPHDINYW